MVYEHWYVLIREPWSALKHRFIDFAIATSLIWIVIQGAHASDALTWQVTERLVNTAHEQIILRGRTEDEIGRLSKSQVVKLWSAKERIAAAGAMSDVVLAVTNQPEPNAYGGKLKDGRNGVIFTLPMLRLLGEDEELMAVVMGHEFGHISMKHEGRRERTAIANVVGALAGVIAGQIVPGGGTTTNLAAMAIEFGGKAAIHSFDREQERDADRFGIDLLAKAGYNPFACIRFWRMMEKHRSGGGLFTTHPSDAERIDNLEQLARAQRENFNSAPVVGQGRTAVENGHNTQPSPSAENSLTPQKRPSLLSCNQNSICADGEVCRFGKCIYP